MFIKKISILLVVGIVPIAVLATSNTVYNQPNTFSNQNNTTGAYIEGGFGYSQYGFNDTMDWTGYNWNVLNGNWALSGDIGYQFTQYFAAELGGIYTAKSTVGYFYDFNKQKWTGDANVQPWNAYLAGKVLIPIFEKMSGFVKLGLGYQNVKINSTSGLDASSSQTSELGPMFGAGLAYNLTPRVDVYGQWLHFVSRSNNSMFADINSPNMFLVGVGYKFGM